MSIESTKTNMPKHVSIMMDGNRRWADEKGLPTLEGHRRGAETLEKLVNYSKEIGLECLSAWAFSTENWKRSETEINYIFDLVRQLTAKFTKQCLEEKVRFVHLGRKDRLPVDIVKTISDMEEKTKDFEGFTLALAVDYGGQDELIRTVTKLTNEGMEITPENIEKNLDTHSLPRVDLIIRTGGEVRLSGYLLWQCAYSELYFTKTYFPDFMPEKLNLAIEGFSNRERRFGGDTKNAEILKKRASIGTTV